MSTFKEEIIYFPLLLHHLGLAKQNKYSNMSQNRNLQYPSNIHASGGFQWLCWIYGIWHHYLSKVLYNIIIAIHYSTELNVIFKIMYSTTPMLNCIFNQRWIIYRLDQFLMSWLFTKLCNLSLNIQPREGSKHLPIFYQTAKCSSTTNVIETDLIFLHTPEINPEIIYLQYNNLKHIQVFVTEHSAH